MASRQEEAESGNKRLQIRVGPGVKWVVASGISIRAIIVFNIYIYDFDSGISSDVSKFADDAKIGRLIRSDSDSDYRQIWIG